MNLFGRRGDAPPAPDQELTDEQALARYRYMLSTAPPEDIERAHEEAFARLTPEQRRKALEALARVVPPSEIRGDDPASLARTATRAEIRQPGTIERAWGDAAPGLGSWFLATLAGSFIGTAIAQSFFDNDPGFGGTGDTGEGSHPGSDDAVADDAGADDGGNEFGGDVADGAMGGEFGGGDFGGGDFGGI